MELLDTAERLMSAKGYAATSISDVAKASGLPTSSIYWHFTSKSGLLGAALERGADRYFESTGRALKLVGESPVERLAAFMSLSEASIAAHPAFLRLFMVLLLDAEGEHAQEAAVHQVRALGKAKMRAGLRLVYEPWGEQVADRVAAELGDLAIALFDGCFIALQADDSAGLARLFDQCVTALHALAEGVRASTTG